MRFFIIGCGKLGINIANALMIAQPNERHIISLYEPLSANRQKVYNGDFMEMIMVAKATGNSVIWKKNIDNKSDVYIITAGKPRISSKQNKAELYAENLQIVSKLMPKTDALVYIATNPPEEIAKTLNAIPLRACTDDLRKACWGNNWKRMNDLILDTKGYTSFAPAIAIVNQILDETD